MSCRIEIFRSPDGAGIAAARRGSGKPFLIVPTLAATIETTCSAYAEAFPDREVITYDRRGTGLSERGAPPGDAEPYLQDARTVADGLGLDHFDLLGTLMGTIEAVAFAARSPDRIGRLVLRAPVTGLADWATIPAVRAALAAMGQDWEFFTEAFSQLVIGWGRPGAPAMAARMRGLTTREELSGLIEAFRRLNLASLYPRIRASTLVEHHPTYFFPDGYTRRIASWIDRCRLAIYSGDDFIGDQSIARAFLAEVDEPCPDGAEAAFRTVLFTDLVSSTELTQRLGDEASQTMLRKHDAIVRTALGRHGGREVKHTGDGIMGSFSSAVAAVRAGLEIQEKLAEARIEARIGLNAGEPIAEGADLFGSVVQLAARITARAAAGQVLVSNVVRELCAGKGLAFEPLEEVELKGFSGRIALFVAGPEISRHKGSDERGQRRVR
jgi:class 3 adenylate cyclase